MAHDQPESVLTLRLLSAHVFSHLCAYRIYLWFSLLILEDFASFWLLIILSFSSPHLHSGTLVDGRRRPLDNVRALREREVEDVRLGEGQGLRPAHSARMHRKHSPALGVLVSLLFNYISY